MRRFLIGCLAVLAGGVAQATDLLSAFVGAESGESAPVRLENRATNTTVRAVVHGVEWKSADSNSVAVVWDTTKEA